MNRLTTDRAIRHSFQLCSRDKRFRPATVGCQVKFADAISAIKSHSDGKTEEWTGGETDGHLPIYVTYSSHLWRPTSACLDSRECVRLEADRSVRGGAFGQVTCLPGDP